MHLELGSAMRGVGGCEVDCCHLFAGARQGSTTMLAIDIGSLREVMKRFILAICIVLAARLSSDFRVIL